MPRRARTPAVSELVRAQDRIGFAYFEYCSISRDSNAITVSDARGVVHLPSATLGALLLGPGTTVTQQAMVLLAESGSTVVWVGAGGVRYYGHGRGLSESSRLLEKQAALVSNRVTRLRVARAMYSRRFPGEDTGRLTMQQLRGREGARVRRAYRQHSERTGVEWKGRQYDSSDFGTGDRVNQALSAANTCLYGIVHSVIVAVGCSPGLGFVHSGHSRSFVYDIADLYKADLTIPLAFNLAREVQFNVSSEARRQFRDVVQEARLLERCSQDIRSILDEEDPGDGPVMVSLWNGSQGTLPGGTNYGDSNP